jgi:hypothetical protein
MPRARVETGGARVALAREAGMGRPSLISGLAGTLVAYGSFAVLIAIAGGLLEVFDVNIDLYLNDWDRLKTGGGLVVAACLLLCYVFGGYVAGRMARRAGLLNGLLVFVMGVLVAVGAAGFVQLLTETDAIHRNLRNVGVPTSADEWGEVVTVAGVGSLAAMLVGSVLGGLLGDRWHGKLLAKAADPTVGPEAEAAEGRAFQREYTPPPPSRPASEPVASVGTSWRRDRPATTAVDETPDSRRDRR